MQLLYIKGINVQYIYLSSLFNTYFSIIQNETRIPTRTTAEISSTLHTMNSTGSTTETPSLATFNSMGRPLWPFNPTSVERPFHPASIQRRIPFETWRRFGIIEKRYHSKL